MTLALGSLTPVFRAIVRTVVPEARDLDEARWHELEALVNDSLQRRPPALRRRVRVFIRLVQFGPLLRWGRRFTDLDPQRQARFLAALQASRVDVIRLGFWGVRTLAFLGYYGREDAAEAIGYRPHPRGWEAR